MKTHPALLTGALFTLLPSHGFTGELPQVPPFETRLQVHVQVIQLAKDDGSDPIEVEGFIDRAKVQDCYNLCNVEIIWRPVKLFKSTAVYDIETVEESAQLGTRSYDDPDVQALFAAHPNDVLMFFGHSEFLGGVRKGTEIAGFGYGVGKVCYVTHGSVYNDISHLLHAHEIGHALRLGHSGVPENLMYEAPLTSQSVQLTEDQINLVRETVFRLIVLEEERLNPPLPKITRLQKIPGSKWLRFHFENAKPERWYEVWISHDLENWEFYDYQCSDTANGVWFVPVPDPSLKQCFFQVRLYRYY